MQIKQLFDDEQAVSPVIGVILMVAITVILAAVIGTFVLGLGDQVQNSAPNANFQFEYDGDFSSGTGNTLTVTHNGGQDVTASNVVVQVAGVDAYDGDTPTFGTDWTVNSNNWGSGDDSIDTGSSLAMDYDASSGGDITGEDVRVIWESPNGDSSNTIGSSTVPA